MKRFILVLLGVTILVTLIGYAFRAEITMRVIERFVASNFETDLLREVPRGLHVALCGAGSPLPDPKRSGPCTAVIAGDRLYIVDVGSGSSRTLSRMRIPLAEVDGVLLTHFHSDHIDGLGELMLQRWANGAKTSPTPVYGPEGVEQIVDGFNLAYGPDRRYRIAHHGEAVVPPSGAGGVARPFKAPAEGVGEILIDEGGLKITAFRVSHMPVEPAVGYRFDYEGRSVLLSGDTTKSANLQKFAADADLLVHEALAPRLVAVITKGAASAGRENLASITRDILEYHSSPIEAAEVARDARVGHLLYNHIVPPLLLPPMEDIFLEGVSDVYKGPVTVGRDGTLVELEAGSDSIRVSELL